jgi:hypothetical protein
MGAWRIQRIRSSIVETSMTLDDSKISRAFSSQSGARPALNVSFQAHECVRDEERQGQQTPFWEQGNTIS